MDDLARLMDALEAMEDGADSAASLIPDVLADEGEDGTTVETLDGAASPGTGQFPLDLLPGMTEDAEAAITPGPTAFAFQPARGNQVGKANVAQKSRNADAAAMLEVTQAGGALSPERAQALVLQVVESALTDSNRSKDALGSVLSALQRTAPEVFGDLVTGFLRTGIWLQAMNARANPLYLQLAMVLRAQMIGELGLTAAHEIALLDVAMGHWVEARELRLLAAGARKPADRSRYLQLAQGEDRLFVNLLQQLRNRNRPRIGTVSVSNAATVAVQINEGGPPAPAPQCTADPVRSEPVEDRSAHLFGKK